MAQRLLALTQQRRSALEALARLVDAPLPEGAVAAAEAAPLARADREGLIALARRHRAEAHALEAAAKRAAAQVSLAEKQFMPDFGVNLTYFDLVAADVMPSMTGRDALAVGISVKVPLQRGRLRAGVEEARLRAAQVTARREALATAFATEIADALSRIQRETEQLTLYDETLVPQAETALEASVAAYTAGRAGFLDLLDAERVLFSLHMSREEAYTRFLQAAAALERALGVASLEEAAALLHALPASSDLE